MFLERILDENVYLYSDVIPNGPELVTLVEALDSEPDTHAAAEAWRFWYPSDETGLVYGSTKVLDPSRLDEIPEHYREKVTYIVSEVSNSINSIATQFFVDKNFGISPNVSTFTRISKYMPGCVMGAHFDSQTGDTEMQWSIIIYPNDDYEGGEISFMVRDIDFRLPKNGKFRPSDDANDPRNLDLVDFTLKPKAGQALIFPSTHPYMHQVHTLKSGVKYIIPGYIYKQQNTDN
jgi:hypothetical protein